MIKDTNFYNKESASYSEKRYPLIATNYNQFFFTERLRLIIDELKKHVGQQQRLSLFEIGCADGVVVHTLQAQLPQVFSKIVAIDISSGMIDAAKKKFGDSGIEFLTRESYNDTNLYDVVLEIGVMNYTTFHDELEYIAMNLKPEGLAMITLAGTGSLWDRTRKTGNGFRTFSAYKQYEAAIRKHFTIEKAIPVGLPIRLIWRMPALGRIVSRGLENILRRLTPNLFHEKIYILKLAPTIQE